MLPEPREHGPEIQQGAIDTILESVDSEARQGLKEALDICLNILFGSVSIFFIVIN